MNIKKLINGRQTFFFDQEKVPPKEDIQQIVDLICKRGPSNQNRVPWEIHVLGPENNEEKMLLYQYGWCDDPIDKDDRRQPQLYTAPYILVWVYRDQEKIALNDPWNMNLNYKAEASLEAGMAAAETMLLAREKGFDTAYCKCMRHSREGDWGNYKDTTIEDFKQSSWQWLTPLWTKSATEEYIDDQHFKGGYPIITMSIGYKDENVTSSRNKEVELPNGFKVNFKYQQPSQNQRPSIESLRKYYW